MLHHVVLLTPDELLAVRWYQEREALFYGELVLSDLREHARRSQTDPLRFLEYAESHLCRALSLRLAYDFPVLSELSRSDTERTRPEDD